MKVYEDPESHDELSQQFNSGTNVETPVLT